MLPLGEGVQTLGVDSADYQLGLLEEHLGTDGLVVVEDSASLLRAYVALLQDDRALAIVLVLLVLYPILDLVLGGDRQLVAV